MVKFKEIKSKTVLNRYKYRDNWFWCRYSLNPYRGCQFACNYCDAITEKYLVHEKVKDFSRIIYAKTNAPELLKKETKKAKRDVVALSGVTDPYQPAERKYGLTRKMLEILRDNGFPVLIGTKSDLVLKDIDVLSKISEKSWCAVFITIITFNKKLLPLLEPFAPPPERRLEAVRKLNKAGVQAGVDFTPIIPYILDDDKNIEEVIKKAAEAGARYILPGAGMTLRSNQRVRFLALLEENWPELIEKYKGLYGTSESPAKDYTVKVNKKTFEFCKKFNIPNFIPPPDFERPFKENFEVANLLLLMAYFKEMRAGNPYAAWAYHRAAKTIEELEENIREIHEKNELEKIPGVGKSLAKTIAEFLITGKCKKLEEMKSKW
jgi:DNA repair photolyase